MDGEQGFIDREQEAFEEVAQTADTPEPTPVVTPTAAPLKPAEDITMACALNGYVGPSHPTSMRDNHYGTAWTSYKQEGVHQLTVSAPKGKTIGGILIRWATWPLAAAVQTQINGEWVTVASCDADFMAQYIPVPNLTDFRVISRDDEGLTRLQICEVTIVTPGALPEDFQVWEKPPEKIDLMLFATHPDDEVLWFGGLLPTYGGEQGKDVLVVCAAHNNYQRRLELCDSLWTCGIRIYPRFLGYADVGYADQAKIIEAWFGRNRVYGDIVGLYRQYRPDVVVTHAVGGESGHSAHKTYSRVCRESVALAADASQFPESAALYGTWLVPKVYVHLWEENQLRMDWHVPLERFGGLNGMEVAALAYARHITQRGKFYSVREGGETDCSLFGLYHTTVGPDVEKNDLFEHIPARGEE